MVNTASIIDINSSLAEQCRQFSDILGLDEAVSEEVLRAALQNESYARNLLLSKESPVMLKQLLRNPRTSGLGTQEFSNLELISKAASALVRWGKTGFTMVNQIVLERRENACLSCPNLRDSKGLLQNNVPSLVQGEKIGQRTGKQVCDLCGCNVSNKIRLPSEACPDVHPQNVNQTRWGEPLPDFLTKGKDAGN